MSVSFRFCMHNLGPATMEQHGTILSMLKSLPKARDVSDGRLWRDIASGCPASGKIPFFRAGRTAEVPVYVLADMTRSKSGNFTDAELKRLVPGWTSSSMYIYIDLYDSKQFLRAHFKLGNSLAQSQAIAVTTVPKYMSDNYRKFMGGMLQSEKANGVEAFPINDVSILNTMPSIQVAPDGPDDFLAPNGNADGPYFNDQGSSSSSTLSLNYV